MRPPARRSAYTGYGFATNDELLGSNPIPAGSTPTWLGSVRSAICEASLRAGSSSDHPKSVFQIGRKGILELEAPPRRRMIERQSPGMKERPGQAEPACVVAAPSICPIAQHWMAGGGQMDPDLVRAAGARPRFDQGSSGEALADAHLGGGLLPHPASDVDAGPSPG